MKTKILITGGSGFIGRQLIKKITNINNNIDIYNLSPTHIKGTKHIYMKKNCIFDFNQINIQFDYILHTLALSSNYYCENFKLAEKINILLTKKLLFFAKKQKKIKKMIYFSSIMLYDNKNIPPVKESDNLNYYYSNYSFTKGIAEEYVKYFSKIYNIPNIILRLSNIYGPGQSYINSPFLIPEKIYEGLTKGYIKIHNGKPIRDFLYIDDAIDAIYSIMLSRCNGIYNLGTGKGTSIENIIKKISEALGVNYKSGNVDIIGPVRFYTDISKIKKDLNWYPKINLDTGIEKTINYIKEYYENSYN